MVAAKGVGGACGDTLALSGHNTAGTLGTVALTGGDLRYLAPSATGTGRFDYTVSDQYGDSDGDDCPQQQHRQYRTSPTIRV